MLNKRNILGLMLFPLALFGPANTVVCQTEARIAGRERAAGTSAPQSVAGTREPDLRKDPILVSFRDGEFVRADLVGPEPEDPDLIVVRIGNTLRSIKLDEVTIRREPKKFDEYVNLKFNDEKARLDNYAIELQQQPGSQGYMINYGSCADEARKRSDRAVDYLVNTRGIDLSRLTKVIGGCRSQLTIELWLVPSGATAPADSTEGILTACPKCKEPTKKPQKRSPKTRRPKKSR